MSEYFGYMKYFADIKQCKIAGPKKSITSLQAKLTIEGTAKLPHRQLIFLT